MISKYSTQIAHKFPAALTIMLTTCLTISLGACTHDANRKETPNISFIPILESGELPLPAKYSKSFVEPSAELPSAELDDITLEETIDFSIQPVADKSIWPRIQAGFRLETDLSQKRLQREIEWFSSHKEYLDRVMKRSEPFIHFIMNEIEKRDMPAELALLPIVESAYQPFAYSHGRAAGIWQFIPSTGRLYGLKQNWWYDGRRDIHASTMAALNYLENLNKLFKGDWMHALAAYNSGSGTVQRAIRKNKRRNRATDFWHLKLPRETQTYVPKLLALKEIIAYPRKHEVTLRCINDAPGFIEVSPDSQIDLALAAEMADIDLDTLYEYNPAFNRWSTPPNGPHRLLLPVESVELFEANLAKVPKNKRLKWKRHRIRTGETLSDIAYRYRTTLSHLRKVNNIRGNNIRAGKYLLIPVSSRHRSEYALSANQRKKAIKGSSYGKKGKTRISHTVQAGESFWEISRKYGVGMRSLAKWNAMATRDTLRKGQNIVVWVSNNPSHRSVKKRKPSNTIRPISYTVRRGDSLSRIASRFKVRVSDLHRWNSIRGKYLKPGQRIKLYIDITEQAG